MDPTAKTDQVPLLKKQLVAVLVPMLEGLEQAQEELKELELGLRPERRAAAVQAAIATQEDHSMGLTPVQAMAKVAECLHWDQLGKREAIARHLLDLRSYLLI